MEGVERPAQAPPRRSRLQVVGDAFGIEVDIGRGDVGLGDCGERVHTAHSPSPRSTLYGSWRFQSMNMPIVFSEKSTGRVRSLTFSSKLSEPTRSAKALKVSPSERSAS